MNGIFRIIVLWLTVALSLPVSAEMIVLRLGTATKGGGFELYGRNLAAVIGETDPSFSIDVRATAGSTENLALLEAGELDVGLVEGNAAHRAFEGIERPRTKLRIIAAMYPGPGMFVVRGNSPYRTLQDLIGKPVAFGTPASGLTQLARDVLGGLDLSPEKDFQPVFLEKAGDGPKLLLDGKVVALWGAGIGWPGFVKVSDAPHGARFIVPNASELKRIRDRHPHLRLMTVPAKSYAGQKKPVPSIGLWSYVLARADLPDETAFRLIRAIHLGESKLASRLPQAAYTTVATTASEVPRTSLLHPGVVRYLQEVRVLK